MRSAAALLVATLAVAALSACGSDAASDGATGSSASDAPTADGDGAGTSLTIVVRTAEDAAATTYELTCDPAGGDHPQAEQACAALDRAGADVFEAVPSDQACTMIYGGPQTATVTGTVDGQDVDASFSRQDGCEVDRWDTLGTTFFNVPLQ